MRCGTAKLMRQGTKLRCRLMKQGTDWYRIIVLLISIYDEYNEFQSTTCAMPIAVRHVGTVMQSLKAKKIQIIPGRSITNAKFMRIVRN